MLRLMPHPLQFAFQSAGPLPARSLSCRLCRDASSPLPPSSDVGKFIRGAAFPTARAGLRRPQMRSAALFRPSDGFSARPGNASSSRPPSPDVGKFIRGAAFPIARAGLRRPLMRSAVECSRPAALFRAPDGLSARPGMSPPRAAGGIPAPATNRPRGACPVGFAGTHRLLSRLLRMSENSSGGTAFPTARAGLRRPQMRSAALFRPSDGFSARPGNASADAPRGPLSPVRRIFGTPRHVAAPCGGGGIPAPATNRPRRTAPEVRRPRAPQLRPYSSPEAPSPSRCVPFARSAKFARAQPAAFARIMRYARPLRMFACSETAPHET